MSRIETLSVPYSILHQENYDEKKYISKAEKLLGPIDTSHRRIHSGLFIPSAYRDTVSSFSVLGQRNFANSGSIDILAVKIAPGISLNDSHDACIGFLRHYLKKRAASGAVCVFVASAEPAFTEVLYESQSLLRLDSSGQTAKFIALEAVKNLVEKKCRLTRRAIDGYFSNSIFLYDDILIAREAPAIDRALTEMRFCDIACGGGELVLCMAETVADARESLNKYLPANFGGTRTRKAFLKNFFENSLYAADANEAAAVLLKAMLALRYPFASITDGRIKWGSVLIEEVFGNMRFDTVTTFPPHLRGESIAPIKEYLSGYYSNKFNADIYCYYIEKAIEMLSRDGSAIILSSDRWLKASYGAGLRELFSVHAPRFAVLLGRRPDIFGSAIKMCAISCFAEPDSSEYPVIHAEDVPADEDLSDHICAENLQPNASNISANDSFDEMKRSLLKKISENSVPLSDCVGGRVYRGLLTGLNKAFVAGDAECRCFTQDNSLRHLLPFYTGREVKKWALPTSRKHLIYFEKGFTNSKKGSQEPLRWFAENYPELAAHLAPFENEAKKRRDKGDYWWELRSCRYIDIFKNDMLMLPGITKKLSAALAPAGVYVNDKCSVIGSGDYFLLALLNSKLLDFVFRQSAPELLNGYYELRTANLSALPICRLRASSAKIKAGIEVCAQKLHQMISDEPLQKHGRPSQALISLEKEIDASVYRLYGLTADERSFIENY